MSDLSVDDLEAQIRAIEERIANEPARLEQERERRLTIMPAPDEVREQQHKSMHRVELTRGEVRNIRIGQTKDIALLVFFLLAIASMSVWIYRALQGV